MISNSDYDASSWIFLSKLEWPNYFDQTAGREITCTFYLWLKNVVIVVLSCMDYISQGGINFSSSHLEPFRIDQFWSERVSIVNFYFLWCNRIFSHYLQVRTLALPFDKLKTILPVWLTRCDCFYFLYFAKLPNVICVYMMGLWYGRKICSKCILPGHCC